MGPRYRIDVPGLRVLDVAPGATVPLATGDDETLVLPLAGSFTVDETVVNGRTSAFAGPTDFVYLPPGTTADLYAARGACVALPHAPGGRGRARRYQAAAASPVEIRGRGVTERRVTNLCMPDSFDAGALMVCEVHTPAGHWSSYPPHKHDEDAEVDGVVVETALTELYYYELAGPGRAYQRVYASDERPIDIVAEVRSGDVVMVPYGWHGPSIAPPGADLYYLNVMTGSRRAWRCRTDTSWGAP